MWGLLGEDLDAAGAVCWVGGGVSWILIWILLGAREDVKQGVRGSGTGLSGAAVGCLDFCEVAAGVLRERLDQLVRFGGVRDGKWEDAYLDLVELAHICC